MAARQFIRLTKEATFGTFNGSPGTDEQIIMEIVNSSASTLRPMPLTWSIRSHGASNRKVKQGTQQLAFKGTLSTLLFPSQATFLANMATAVSGSPLELPSFTVDEVDVMEDSSRTKNYRRTLGVKINKLALTANNSGDGQILSVSMDVTGKDKATITGTDFSEPALTDYPSASENPYVFQHSSTAFSVGGAAVSNYSSLGLTISNILGDHNFDESNRIQRLPWCGRDVSLTARLLFKTAQHRTDFEAQTAKSITLAFNDGTTTLTFDFNDVNYYTDVKDDFPMNNSFFLNATWDNLVDTAAGTDFTASVA